MFTHSAPGGRAHLQLRSSNPDPARRFVLTVSDGFAVGADGVRELANAMLKFADEVDPAPKKAKASAKKG